MDIDLNFIKNEYFLNKLKNYLERLFRIDKEIKGIILFGSLARNEEIYSRKKISDIDIIVIFQDGEIPISHSKRSYLKIKLMGNALSNIDSIWMTKKQFTKGIDNKMSILLSALYEGKILFDPESLIKEEKKRLFRSLEEKGVKKRKNYWIWPIKHLGEEIEW
ncbi:MAG: nucleotidyltransferase domain-containing protein [Promethearchaeia archaeon]